MSIFRRRLMMGEKKPIEYLEFEDRRVWEVCAYRWGYTQNIQEVDGTSGVLDEGVIEGNDNTIVYSDYIFAASYTIEAHGSVPATEARTVQYRIELYVKGSQSEAGAPWEIATPTSVTNSALYITQQNKVMSSTALKNITLENWSDASYWENQTDLTYSAEKGCWECLVTVTKSCQYLRIGLRAAAGVSVSWKVVSVGVTKKPLGITIKQCAAVSTLGTAFRENQNSRNILIKRFDEYKYFTRITVCSSFGYINNIIKLTLPPSIKSIPVEAVFGLSLSESSYFVVPEGCTTYGNHAIGRYNCHIVTLDLPSTSEKFNGYFMYQCPELQTIKLRATTPPTVSSSTLSGIPSRVQFYVPDASVEAYKTADIWSSYASRIHPLSEIE